MNVSKPSYRQTRSLENIGENSSMDWYRNTNHLIFINENSAIAANDGSSNTNEIIER